jgi:hypothetical protein
MHCSANASIIRKIEQRNPEIDMQDKNSDSTPTMPWSRLMVEFDIDSTSALTAGARADAISLPEGWSAGLTTDADREVDILRLETNGIPTVDAGATVLRELVACGAITRPVPQAFANMAGDADRFQPDPKKPLETKKALAELLGWEGLSVARPTFSGSGQDAVCITIPATGRLAEAKIPNWDSDWNAYGDLILEHHIHVTPGTHCVTAGAVTKADVLVSGTYNYDDHPDKPTAVRFAAMATCIAKLEIDAQFRPAAASSMAGPG